jgi:hypothetical protein
MSNFVTELPVDLDRFKSLLPPGSTVEKMELDEKNGSLKIIWRNPGLVTPYSWPWAWPLTLLESAKVPEGVSWPTRKDQILDAVFTPLKTKGLTVTPDKTIPKASEKVAGKIKKLLAKGKGRASADTADDSTADASSVDGPGPGPTGGLSEQFRGPQNLNHVKGS